MKENSGLAFNGQGGAGFSKSPVSTNHYTGKMNDGALINKGRGPTTAGVTGKHAGPSTAKGKEQYRGVGGTSVKKPGASAKINVGRGPTKGNE